VTRPARRQSDPKERTVTRHPLPVAAAVLLSFAGAGRAADDGMFVTVSNPVTSETVKRLKAEVEARRAAGDRRVTKVVFDFNPDGKPAASTDYGVCYDLANYIRGLQEIQTIAFVHARTTGHTVLPVLACKELVMSRENDTVLGDVAGDGPALNESERKAYELIFGRAAQFAVVQKMFDPEVVLAKGVNNRQNRAIWYIDQRDEERWKKEGIARTEPVPFAPRGQRAAYTADQAKELDLRKATASKRTEVAALYGISSIDDDIIGGRTIDAYRYVLKGDVDGAMRETLGRVVRGIKAKKGNVLFLQLECGGTDLQAARDIADDLRKVWGEGDDRMLVVGFVPDQANDAATFIALGCTDVVMSRRKNAPERDEAREATLGDFEASIAAGAGKPGFVESHRQSLRDLAEKRGRDGVLIDGMFDKTIEIVRARGVVNRSQVKYMTAADWDRANKEEWQHDGTVKPRGQLLKLNATRAAELGFARFVVDGRDAKDAAAVYGVEAEKLKEATPGWLDRFAEFLRMPVVTVLLVVIGFTGLILELKVPGLTVPGIIAALCFILVFWAQSRFSGETFVLAMLLFILGLVLVGLEIFVLPGFGAPGIMGILCMLSGLALVTFDKIPTTGEEWTGLGVKVSTYMFAMIGAFALAFLIARFLPRVPYANRMILRAPAEEPGAGEPLLPGASAAAELLGAIGTANTALRPAGVVRFADDFVDVVSDGGFVAAGTRVQVIAVEGTRIVVKEV
jgi:membrane-bound ClpP family serine protease